jgi:hypothetical protein
MVLLALAACAALTPATAGAAADTPELPDGRGYELVSPLANADGDVYEPTLEGVNDDEGRGYNTERLFQAAADGEAVAYVGDPSAQGGTASEGPGAGNEYLATRAPGGGWSAVNIEPSSDSLAEGSIFQAFSSDLTNGVLDWDGQKPLVEGAPGGGYHVLYSYTPSDGSYSPLFTATPHLSAEEFQVTFAGASANFEELLFMANDALTSEALAGGVGEKNLYESVAGQLRSVNVLGGHADPNATFGAPPLAGSEAPDFSHVISADGSRVFWTDLNTGEVYVRENGETTVPVSAGAARFQTASADGRYAYYTEGEALWRFDVESQAREELQSTGVQAVIGAGEGGEGGVYLYFVSGTDDLYVLHPGQPAHPIAQLSSGDGDDWSSGLGQRTAAVTPDGEQLVFVSRANLTGYGSGGRSEVYLYDAQAQALRCASCDPSGEAPTGSAAYSALLQPSHSDTYLPRWISSDGSRVFFDGIDALVPQASNGKLDVYEWERDGAGSCAQAEGCIYLLSGATGSDNSYFLDADENGDNVFILTREALVPQDQNETFALYDVRVGAPAPPPAPASCSGTGCQGLPSPPLILATPASATFEGAGDLSSATPASGAAGPKVKPLGGRALKQKLAKALKACRARRHKRQRATCQARARRRYGTRSTARKSMRGGRS